MSLFNDILFKISKGFKVNETNRKEIADVFFIETGVVMKPDDIQIKNKVLFLSISPTLKSLVYLKKQKILEKLKLFGVDTIQ